MDNELLELVKEKLDITEHIRDLKQDLGHAMNLVQVEYKKLEEARETLAAIRTEQANIEDSLNFKKLQETINHQTRCNARLAAALIDAEARANDEAVKRLTERHYKIKTGGY